MAARIIIADVELAEFRAADASGVEEFEHGAVAQTKGICCVGDGEEELDFVRREDFGQ